MTDSLLRFEVSKKEGGWIGLRLAGHLSAKTAGRVWREAAALLHTDPPRELHLDVSGLEYCDITGIGLIRDLQLTQDAAHAAFRLEGLHRDHQILLDLVSRRSAPSVPASMPENPQFIENVGRKVAGIWEGVYSQIVFVGEVISHMSWAVMHPKTIRWQGKRILIFKKDLF